MKHIIIYIGVCLWAVSMSVSAQQEHRHSDCLEDSINPMTEAILSEVTVQGVAGTQRLKDAASPFMVVSPKLLHQSVGTNIVDAVGHMPGRERASRSPSSAAWATTEWSSWTRVSARKGSSGVTSTGLKWTSRAYIR